MYKEMKENNDILYDDDYNDNDLQRIKLEVSAVGTR